MTVPDSRIPVWLDCDPGHDDAFAILFSAFHPALRLLGLSTVWGNASLSKTTANALSLLTAMSKAQSIPVYVGAATALSRPGMHAPTDIHGESGLDGTELLPRVPSSRAITDVDAIDAAAQALFKEKRGTPWVVATGAFTNTAALFKKYPGLIEHVSGLSLMGGAVGGGFTSAILGVVDGTPRVGNWTQWAEFNVFADPEAAAYIFGNKTLAAKTTLVPLDLTHQVLATKQVRQLILHGEEGRRLDMDDTMPGKTRLRTMLVELLMFFAKTYADVFGISDGPPLHDPLAVAAVLGDAPEPEERVPFHDFVEGEPGARERFEVIVVTEGTYEEGKAGVHRTGQTVVRFLPRGEEGVRIPRRLDQERFWTVLERCVGRADEANAIAGGRMEEGV